jgi:hypothetical protein
LVSASIAAKLKCSEIFIVNIRGCIDKIWEEEEEATPHKPADPETGRLHARKAFAHLFEAPMGVPPALKHDICIDTDPTAIPPHQQPYRM